MKAFEDLANQSIRVPGPVQSNQLGEIIAVVASLQAIENYVPITHGGQIGVK
jgi:hypothetical protein